MLNTTLWTLIALQVAIGAFDTLYHHEFTERLPWRRSQRRELQLHGVRNLLYAAIFLILGLTEIDGLFAAGLIAILGLELLITLRDFVEEDRTRTLPASERIAHTLLGVNYGAILVLLVPLLLDRAAAPTGIAFTNYGVWSVLAVAAAFAVLVFGIRDLAASRRLAGIARIPAAGLINGYPKRQNILITGATGFIGQRLTAALVAAGHGVTVLTRRPANAVTLPVPLRIVTDLDQIPDNARIDAIINLAGEPVAARPWTARQRRKILRSRLRTTRGLVQLMARLRETPNIFISSSAIGVYGVKVDEPVDERSQIVADGSFSNRSCAACEAEAQRAEALGVRTICLRTGLVLDTEGGALAQMLTPFEFGTGGPFGRGDHWMSWISRDDVVRLIGHCLNRPGIRGPVNATSPNPVRNADFAKTLGAVLHRPAVIPVPRFILAGMLGDLGREIFLGSQNVLPAKALGDGFEFRDADLHECLRRMIRIPPRHRDASRETILAGAAAGPPTPPG